MGSRSMKDVGGAVLAGSSPLLERERAAVDVDPERRSPRFHFRSWRQKFFGGRLSLGI